MASKPEIQISKDPSMADEKIDVWITGLKRNQKITLHGSTTLPNGAVFESYAHYAVGDQGHVLLNADKSMHGTYVGIEPMGPFWSLQPSPFNKVLLTTLRKHERFLVKEPMIPFVISLRVYDSFLSLEEIKISRENYVCSLNVSRTYSAPGVSYEEVRVGRVRGYLFLPPGKGPFPGIISMSGGHPGAMKYKGALLASHGYATLALKYFGEDDLPMHVFYLDMSYFEEAAMYLKNHSKVYGQKGIGIVANCFGASLALGLAGCSAPGLINCVVSISSWFFCGWQMTYKEKVWPMPSNFNIEMEAKADGFLRKYFKLNYSTDPTDKRWEPHLFDFYKRHDIPYLLILGENDASFDSKTCCTFTKMLFEKEHHRKHEILFYPRAGHLIEHAYNPFGKVAYTLDAFLYYGGEQPEHERAQEDSWRKILSFLERNMSPVKLSKL